MIALNNMNPDLKHRGTLDYFQVIKTPSQAMLAGLLGSAIGVMFTVSVVELVIRNAMESDVFLVLCSSTVSLSDSHLTFYLSVLSRCPARCMMADHVARSRPQRLNLDLSCVVLLQSSCCRLWELGLLDLSVESKT